MGRKLWDVVRRRENVLTGVRLGQTVCISIGSVDREPLDALDTLKLVEAA